MSDLAKRAVGLRRKIVVLCGSSRFVQEMAVCAWLLERDEGVIAMGLHLLPGWYGGGKCPDDHLAEHEGVAGQMDALHLCKVELADEIFIVNRGDYIGSSTRGEIEYAAQLGKPLRWYVSDPIGRACEDLIDQAVANAKQDAAAERKETSQ